MPIYQPLVPTGTVNLDVDYQNLQGNFEQANIVYGTDHYALDNSSSNQGFHDKVTMPARTDPTTTALQGVTYTKDSVATPGRTDLYYAYQTAGGTPFTGTFFPLNIIKAFGKATVAGNLVAGSSFNVASAVFSTVPDRWTITFTSAICANTVADLARVIVLALPQVSSLGLGPVCVSLPLTSPTSAVVIVNGTNVTGISFAILVI